MRLKVKSLFMIAAGLLFCGGPMARPSLATGTPINVTVTAGDPTITSTNGCSGESVSETLALNKTNVYDLVYTFTLPNSQDTCDAKMHFDFVIPSVPTDYTAGSGMVATLDLETRTASPVRLEWGNNTLHLNENNSYEDGDNLQLLMSTLNFTVPVGETTYKINYAFNEAESGCTYEKLEGNNGYIKTACSTYLQFVDSGGNILSGNVIVKVYRDGQDNLGISGGETNGPSGTTLSCADNGTTIIGGNNTPALVQKTQYQWVYTYKINAGQTVCDAVPIGLQVIDADKTKGDAPGITSDSYGLAVSCDKSKSSSNFCDSNHASVETISTLSDGDSTTPKAYFDSGQLNTPGTFDFFFKVSDTSNSDDLSTYLDCPAGTTSSSCLSDDDASDGYVHIQIVVSSNTQSFFTDGDFAGLLNCANETTKSKDGVTFAIVPGGQGGHTIKATNPGEFFYNLIWTNGTQTEQTISFSVPTSYNVTSQGAESVHAYAFNPSNPGGFDENVTSFDTVLGSGTPCNDPTSNTCTIQNVPAGDVVWIVWHVSYSQIGNSTSNLPKYADTGVCPNSTSVPTGTPGAKNNIYAVGQITYTGLSTPITSSASAWGYLKH